MAIKEFELMHGAVLTKICRNDQPIALTLVETRDRERNVYYVNSDTVLYIKHSATPKQTNGKSRWQFTFQAEHLEDLTEFSQSGTLYIALVCGSENLKGNMEVCLLYSDELIACLDLTTKVTQWIAVEKEGRNQLRAFGSSNSNNSSQLKIPRNRLDTLKIPGR